MNIFQYLQTPFLSAKETHMRHSLVYVGYDAMDWKIDRLGPNYFIPPIEI